MRPVVVSPRQHPTSIHVHHHNMYLLQPSFTPQHVPATATIHHNMYTLHSER